MIKSSKLEDWLHRPISRTDKLVIILATSSGPLMVADIKKKATSAGLREVSNWNVSQYLKKSKGLAILVDNGWKITIKGKEHIRELGVLGEKHVAKRISDDLRVHLNKIKDTQTREFIEEAVKCHEAELFRAAIVMSWIGAIDALHKYVHSKHLKEFNEEARRVNPNWKSAKTPNDLGNMREVDFLDRAASISVISKSVKLELKKALELRNACSHPSSLKVSVNKSAAHIETLLQNIFNILL